MWCHDSPHCMPQMVMSWQSPSLPCKQHHCTRLPYDRPIEFCDPTSPHCHNQEYHRPCAASDPPQHKPGHLRIRYQMSMWDGSQVAECGQFTHNENRSMDETRVSDLYSLWNWGFEHWFSNKNGNPHPVHQCCWLTLLFPWPAFSWWTQLTSSSLLAGFGTMSWWCPMAPWMMASEYRSESVTLGTTERGPTLHSLCRSPRGWCLHPSNYYPFWWGV
jgi:hypothetical protein